MCGLVPLDVVWVAIGPLARCEIVVVLLPVAIDELYAWPLLIVSFHLILPPAILYLMYTVWVSLRFMNSSTEYFG